VLWRCCKSQLLKPINTTFQHNVEKEINLDKKKKISGEPLRCHMGVPSSFIEEPGISVSIVTGYGLGGQGSIPNRGRGFFLCPLRPDLLWGPPSLLYNGYGGLFPGGKGRPGRDADHYLLLVQRSGKSRSYTSSRHKLHFGLWRDSFSSFIFSALNFYSGHKTAPCRSLQCIVILKSYA
jgi:hypothetical protein